MNRSDRGSPANPSNFNNIPEGYNRLFFEKSPYLLQHAKNPVNWYPWGDEAFEKARVEEKPVFLSIGYSTCHWCHVMERESFDDPEVAAVMNDVFVSIKVDREERPDIDNIYMTVCQLMTGSGGWPLNIVMTPDKKPFFAGTYFPKESVSGRIGIIDLARRIKEVYSNRRVEVIDSAEKVTLALQSQISESPGQALDKSTLDMAYRQLSDRFDEANGGFADAPKFPTPHNLTFLLRYFKRTGDPKALLMVQKTLESMRAGGIFDHIGFGFHRYSTDAKWLVPHFEKMLYDQALLAMAYTEACQVTGKADYSATTDEIFAYVLRDMTSPEGGFYSAEDADSEGVEGKFYIWSADEIKKALSIDDAALIKSIFNIREDGNWVDEAAGENTGTNIPHLKGPITDTDTHNQVKAALGKLFDIREKRAHPFKDDKILTDWNGLMIAALAKAGRAFGKKEYIAAAETAARFILKKMRAADGALYHRFRDGEAGLQAHIDDYAFMTWGLIEIYGATFKIEHLKPALELTDYMITHFWDQKAGGFYYTADDVTGNIARSKEIYDGALPSGNSVAALNLLRLGRITANPEYEKMATAIGAAFAQIAQQAPVALTQLMAAVDFSVGPQYEVVIVGEPERHDTQKMIAALNNRFLPNAVVVLKSASSIDKYAPYTREMVEIDGKTTAYVCRNHACELPTNDVKEMPRLLN